MWTNSLILHGLYHRWKYVGWIISFYTAGVATWPCGFDDERCPTENEYAPNPRICRQYYRCVHHKWVLHNCSNTSPNYCGEPVEYCRLQWCLDHLTASPTERHSNTTRKKNRTTIFTSTDQSSTETTVTRAVSSTTTSTTAKLKVKSTTSHSDINIGSSTHEGVSSTRATLTTKEMLAQGGDKLPNTGGSSDGGVVAGSIIAVILVLAILTLGLIWWKRRDLLLRIFKKSDPMNSTVEYDIPYVYQNPEDKKAGKEKPRNNNELRTNHIYSEPAKKLSQVSHGGDMSAVFMRSNSFYGGDEPFYNSADDTKYDVVDSHEYSYTRPTGYEANAKDVHYDTTPSEADDVYYSTVAKEIDGANKQNWKDVRQPPRSGTPPYADIIPKSKRASDPNVADDIDDYSLARDPGLANQQEPLYFELENPADAPHYQNTNNT